MQNRDAWERVYLTNPNWPLLRQWIAEAQVPVEVLDRSLPDTTLLSLDVARRWLLGAVAWGTGGILIDHGWLRLLGGGHARLKGLTSWIEVSDRVAAELPDGILIVAHDAVGGFFALNGHFTHFSRSNVFYFAPDTLAWEDLSMGYGDFVHWALLGDLARFYANVRYSGWERETEGITGNQGFSIYPPLWASGGDITERSRQPVPMTELWGLNQEFARQLRHLPDGAQVRLIMDKESTDEATK